MILETVKHRWMFRFCHAHVASSWGHIVLFCFMEQSLSCVVIQGLLIQCVLSVKLRYEHICMGVYLYVYSHTNIYVYTHTHIWVIGKFSYLCKKYIFFKESIDSCTYLWHLVLQRKKCISFNIPFLPYNSGLLPFVSFPPCFTSHQRSAKGDS